jgi:hypothetical protein
LFAVGGNDIPSRRPADRCTALTTTIWRMNRMLV